MNTIIDEQLFTEQVLELVTSIKKRDCVKIEAEQAMPGISNIIGSLCITCGDQSPPVVIDGGVSERYPGDIPIDRVENDKRIKTALEIAEKEIFDCDREEGVSVIADNPRKIKETIIAALCPSLLKTSDDVFEIAKSSTPVLLTLSLSGTISLPIQPVFFAAAAILLARSSIAAICKDSKQLALK